MATVNELKQASKTGTSNDPGIMNHENLHLGAILRIADATEKLVGNYDQMRRDLAYYKENYERRGQRILSLERQLSTAKGWNTRYKNKLKNRNI